MEEIRLDTKNPENLEPEEGARCARLVHEINQTFPLDPKLPALLSELFGSNAGENLRLNPPLFGAASVVTHDVPDYAAAVGNPARVVKFFEKEQFKD